MPSDLTVTLAAVIIAVAVLGYWFGRSGEGAGRLNWRFREFSERLPRRSEKAVDAYLREAENEQKQPDAAFELAAYFRSAGDWRRALQIHESLAARTDLEAGVRARAGLEIGDDYRSAGMLDRAEEAYSRTAEYAPLRPEALRRRLDVCEQLKDWEGAVDVAGQVIQQDPAAGGNLKCHYLCQMAGEAARADDFKRARKLWKQAAKASRSCPRPAVDRAIWGGGTLASGVAAAAGLPQWAELILASLGRRGDSAPAALDKALSEQFSSRPELGERVAVALLMSPGFLCSYSAACLFEALRQSHPAYAAVHAAGSPAAFNAGALKSLTEDLQRTAAGPPRWRCSRCGHEDEAFDWRCVECGAWEAANLISPFAD